MSTLDRHHTLFASIPTDVVISLINIDRARGQATSYERQHPERLAQLQTIARIQSTEASNAIEGISAPFARIRALVENDATPTNRPEQEIAGYRKALDLINSTPPNAIRLTPGMIKQLHKIMSEYTTTPGGQFKTTDNTVEDELPDGTRRTRFHPVPAWRTEDETQRLTDTYRALAADRTIPPLLLIGTYILDLLVIHPFSDGNGRISRLLTHLLLRQAGFHVGCYVSLEKIIDDTRSTYYDALHTSTIGWHEDANDPYPWLRYLVGVVISGAYTHYEQRVGALGGRGTKTAAITTFIQSNLAEEFTIADLRAAAPSTSDAMIKKVLRDLQREGIISPALSRGRAARYRRLKHDT